MLQTPDWLEGMLDQLRDDWQAHPRRWLGIGIGGIMIVVMVSLLLLSYIMRPRFW